MAERQTWITPINPEEYRIFEAFATLPELDLFLSPQPEVGDIVYVYINADNHFTKYKTMVVATGIKSADAIGNKDFLTPKGRKKLAKVDSFTRLRLLEAFPDKAVEGLMLSFKGLYGNLKETKRLSEDCVKELGYYDKPYYFTKGCFAYLIDKCSKEKAVTPKSSKWKGLAENVRLVLPFLANRVSSGSTNLSYLELIKVLVNAKEFVPIEQILEVIHHILTELSKETKQDIPTLSSILTDFSDLPKEPFDYVLNGYKDLSEEDKHKVVDGLSAKAVLYKNWEWVLSMLGLGNKVDKELVDKTRGLCSEVSEEDKNELEQLKQQISEDPKMHFIPSWVKGEVDYVLLSGDKVDVYFPDVKTAFVLLPSTASEEEMLQGIYRCVKVKALLEAETKYNGDFNSVEVYLGLGDAITEKTRRIADLLGINIKEFLSLEEEDFFDDDDDW